MLRYYLLARRGAWEKKKSKKRNRSIDTLQLRVRYLRLVGARTVEQLAVTHTIMANGIILLAHNMY